MNISPRQYQAGITIAAIATPPGEGAISMVRISGPRAIEICKRIYSGPIDSYQSHTAHLGEILTETGHRIDQVMLLLFRAPRSYTGEDLIEIHCHGGSLITRRVLERILEAGALMALPGEFTFQAFCNGKLDLAQAEAVQQFIAARNDLARISSGQQLEGLLSKKINCIQTELTDCAAILEAWVDFPEEGLEFSSMQEMIDRLEKMLDHLRLLTSTFHQGKIIHEGLSLCLIGSPNVGKSSLMNALLGFDRAIVTELAGTTRDLLEEPIRFGSLHFRIIDTAGIRNTEEKIEQEGIRRSAQARDRADLILLLLDASTPLTENDRALLQTTPREKTILVWNKIDLVPPNQQIEWAPIVHLSAKERIGLDRLQTAIEKKIWEVGPPAKDEIVLSSLRHFEALTAAMHHLTAVVKGLKNGLSAEFIAFEMRSALHHLSLITGANVSEEILNSIFSQFCLGK